MPNHYEIADALHSAAIHLLRRLRRVDEATGLSAAKLSTLSAADPLSPVYTQSALHLSQGKKILSGLATQKQNTSFIFLKNPLSGPMEVVMEATLFSVKNVSLYVSLLS